MIGQRYCNSKCPPQCLVALLPQSPSLMPRQSWGQVWRCSSHWDTALCGSSLWDQKTIRKTKSRNLSGGQVCDHKCSALVSHLYVNCPVLTDIFRKPKFCLCCCLWLYPLSTSWSRIYCRMVNSVCISNIPKLSRLTCRIRAVLCIEWSSPHNNLMGNDGIAVDITFLRHTIFTKMFWGRPQIWEDRWREQRRGKERLSSWYSLCLAQ